MKTLRSTLYMAGGLCLCILSLALFWFSPKKLTYLEYRLQTAVSPETVLYDGEEAQTISCRDETGTIDFAILDHITLDVRAGAPLPAAARLCDESGKAVCELDRQVTADHSADAGSGETSCVLFHIPSLRRSGGAMNCSLLILNEEGRPYPLEAVSSYTWYGGARVPFWRLLAGFGVLYGFILLGRILWLVRRGRRAEEDAWVSTMVFTAAVFMVLSVLSSEYFPTIMDENDNIISGFLQFCKGRVLYSDYISQHMPFAHWLCALYAALGARSVGQFRLLFALSAAAVLGLTYCRHRKGPFARAIVFFGIFLGPLGAFLIPGNAGQILYDNIEALAMAVMLVELLAYYEDHEIGWGRAVVISLCVFASAGSAFMAVYSIFACMAAVIMEEIRHFRGKGMDTGFFIRRYGRLVGCVMVPWVFSVLYLGAKGALGDAFDMAFRFNREVYPAYGPAPGVLSSFYSGFLNVGDLLASTWTSLLAGEAMAARVMESVMILITAALLVRSFKKRGPVPTLGLLFFIETQAVRTAVRFHSFMLWTVVFMFILAELPGMALPERTEGRDSLKNGGRRREYLAGVYCAVLIFCLGIGYLKTTRDVSRFRLAPVPEREMMTVLLTEAGEEVFMDAGNLETDYLFCKDRMPANRLLWTLPWYYEWYGEETADVLRQKKPGVAVYRPGISVWDFKGYADETDRVIARYYSQVGEMDLYVRR